MKFQIQSHSISFQALNHHRQTVALFASSVKNQGAQKRTRKPPSSKSWASSSTSVQRSIFAQSEDEVRNTPVVSKKISTKPSSSNSHPPISHQKTVGVLGGVSVISTLTFLEKLVWWSTKDGEGKGTSQEEESIPFIVCSDPSFKPELPLEDRDPLIIEKLRKKRMFLEDGGAGCIVLPCHVSHAWFNEISEGCSLPFLNVVECVALELKEANLKPLEAGSKLKIGVIATEAVLMGGFYQEKLQNQCWELTFYNTGTTTLSLSFDNDKHHWELMCLFKYFKGTTDSEQITGTLLSWELDCPEFPTQGNSKSVQKTAQRETRRSVPDKIKGSVRATDPQRLDELFTELTQSERITCVESTHPWRPSQGHFRH